MNIEKEKEIIGYREPLDYAHLLACLEEFSRRYGMMTLSSIGRTIYGREIPLVRLGEGERAVLYVGTHHASEWITSVILLRFINEFCSLAAGNRRIYDLNLSYLLSTRTIYIIPMLNPDGVELEIHGVGDDNPMRERLLGMNGGSPDFTHWQANGRGVDLNHNYNAGFADYKRLEAEMNIFGGGPTRYSGTGSESEPECAAICDFLRTHDTKAILTLHSQGEEIFFTSGDVVAPRSESLAAILSKLTGYKLSKPDGAAAFGGLTDWYIREFSRPSFTIECGRGENPLPPSEYFGIFVKLREALFTMPILI